MARIDMAQMVRSTGNAKPAKASTDSSGAKTDFAQMLKGKEQAVKEDGGDPKPVKKDEGQETEAVEAVKISQKQEKAPVSPEKEEDVQVPAEVMLQLQAALNQFMQDQGQAAGQADAGAQEALLTEGQGEGLLDAAAGQPEDAAAGAGAKDTAQPIMETMAGDVQAAEAGQTADEGMVPVTVKEAAVQALPQGKEAPARGKVAEVKQQIHDDGGAKEQPVEGLAEPSGYKEASGQGGPGNGENHDARNNHDLTYAGNVQNALNRDRFSGMSVKNQPETVTVKTTPETFTADVGKAIAAKLPGNNGTLTIELEPASLGKMTIKVVYEAGRAAVSIMSANPKTLELLSQSAGDIAHILEEKTGQQTVVYTQDPQQDPDPGQDSRGNDRQQQDREENKRKNRPDSFAQQLRLGLV